MIVNIVALNIVEYKAQGVTIPVFFVAAASSDGYTSVMSKVC